jgi:hypothetical protein
MVAESGLSFGRADAGEGEFTSAAVGRPADARNGLGERRSARYKLADQNP